MAEEPQRGSYAINYVSLQKISWLRRGWRCQDTKVAAGVEGQGHRLFALRFL